MVISAGSERQDPGRDVEGIKTAAANLLVQSDPGVIIRSTEYFNHTYAPDFVLRWANQKNERGVFLRTTSRGDYLRADLDSIDEFNGIVMPLADEPIRFADEDDRADVVRKSVLSSTLIAQPASLAELSRARADRPVAGLLTRAVLQGGRGVVERERAATVGGAVDAGFNAAAIGEDEETRLAVSEIADLIAGPPANRITQVLQAAWVGSGRPASTFPGPVALQARFDPEALLFLLAGETIPDFAFWQKLVRGIDLQTLCDLPEIHASNNLDLLVSAGIDDLHGRILQLLLGEEHQQPSGSSPYWVAGNASLTLRSEDYDVRISPVALSKTRIEDQSSENLPSLQAIRDRAAEHSLNLLEVDIVGPGGDQLAYHASADSLPFDDDETDGRLDLLAAVSSAVGVATTVGAAVVGVTSTRSLRCQFPNRVANGRTNSVFSIAEFLDVGLPLLASTASTAYASEVLIATIIELTGASVEDNGRTSDESVDDGSPA